MREIFRNIFYMSRRFKLASSLNLIGLVIAFAAFYLLMTQIVYQRSYNHSIKDYERLYRMESDFVYNESDYSDNMCRPFADALQLMPDVVESYSLTLSGGSNESFYTLKFLKGKDTVAYAMSPANNTALSTLSPQVVDGKIEWTDTEQEGLIIPKSIALDYFKTEKAEGKEMNIVYPDEDEPFPFKVVGVYEDFPKESELLTRIYYNILTDDSLELSANYKCIVKFKTVPSKQGLDSLNRTLKRAVITHLRNGLKKKGLESKIDTYIDEINQTHFRFIPLKDSYFENTSFSSSSERGYKSMLYIMELVCLLVIVIAAINFLNFTLVESPMRVKSLNTRLVLGASRQSLRRIILGEGVVISLTACLIALLVCWLLQRLPIVSNKLFVGQLSLIHHWSLLIVMGVLAIGVGIIACYYPGNHATSYPTAIVLKGSFGLTPRGKKLRQLLTIFQLFISMLMVIYVGILYSQSRYILKSEYGYDKDQVLSAELPYMIDYNSENDTISHLLKRVAGVADVAFSDNLLGKTDGHGTIWTRTKGQNSFRFTLLHCSRNFPSAMGIEIINGRDFNPSDTAAIIINKAMQERYPWIQLGTVLSTGISDEEPDSAVVVGVCEDIRYGTTRISNHQPFCMVYKEGYPYMSNVNVLVKPDADQITTKDEINAVLINRYHDQITPAQYLNDVLRGTYKNEFRYVNQMVLIGIICLIITLTGILCLTMFETEYRRKEIGIRKVLGATPREIVDMLGRRYAIYILIAFAIAAPVAGIFGWHTLKSFQQHASITGWLWLFPLALLLVGGTMLGTVLIKSWSAAHESPSSSIKDK